MTKRIFILIVVWAVLAAGCGDSSWRTHDITHLMPDLAFTLTGESGRTVTEARFAGKVTLMYFGFSHCRSACPATLARLRAALDELGKRAERVRVLFVSVDPGRDTPERLRRYTDHFGPRFIGLTGGRGQLDRLARRYRVSYGYGEPGEDGAYPVYHSNGVFVFNAEGHAQLLFRSSDGVEAMVKDLSRLLKS